MLRTIINVVIVSSLSFLCWPQEHPTAIRGGQIFTGQGEIIEGGTIIFEKGKIVQASANGNENKLKEILDTDYGARFIGEFAIAFNPHIKEPMCDILFDEKIAGSFHFTPGQAYEEADNGNRSQIHWDLISIQRSDYGGGEIYFDGKLIRKDGLFIPKSLMKLNPDYLLS